MLEMFRLTGSDIFSNKFCRAGYISAHGRLVNYMAQSLNHNILEAIVMLLNSFQFVKMQSYLDEVSICLNMLIETLRIQKFSTFVHMDCHQSRCTHLISNSS
jgi:hypothetical protein